MKWIFSGHAVFAEGNSIPFIATVKKVMMMTDVLEFVGTMGLEPMTSAM